MVEPSSVVHPAVTVFIDQLLQKYVACWKALMEVYYDSRLFRYQSHPHTRGSLESL